MGIRVVVYGLGPIGQLIAKVALARGLEIVGAVDIDPSKVGKDLGELIGIGRELGIKVSGNADSVLKESKPDVVLHATGTWLDKVYGQLVKAIDAGADVVSTCETLAYPWYRYPELARLVDSYAREKGVTVIGVGVNPGFALDALPSLLTVVSSRLDGIRAIRSLDASKRRYSFQKKIGLGLEPGEFRSMLERGEITAHVGFAESTLLIAEILGLRLDEVREGQEPIIADKYYETQYFKVKEGTVRGVRGFGSGIINGREVIRVELVACVGCEEYEEVRLIGEPEVTWRSTGTPGDLSTAAVAVNTATRIGDVRPGLVTLKDLLNYAYRHVG